MQTIINSVWETERQRDTDIRALRHDHGAANIQTQGIRCAKDALRGLQFPSHFLSSLLKTQGPHVAGCYLRNEGKLLWRHGYGQKVSFHSLTLLSCPDYCLHFSCLIFGYFYNLMVMTLCSIYS